MDCPMYFAPLYVGRTMLTFLKLKAITVLLGSYHDCGTLKRHQRALGAGLFKMLVGQFS